MDEAIERALSGRFYIDITTTGRRTGQPRRIELAIHNFDGRLFISGQPSPRKRGWIANLEANPHLTVHGKEPGHAMDLAATARVIDDEAERRPIIARVAAAWRRQDVDRMVAMSPLIEVMIDPVATNAVAADVASA
jgi:deazaflavin-dependent oxidoreductase (nitroreductase family)